MIDHAFRDEVLQRITRVETTQIHILNTLATIDLTTKALHADVLITKSERQGASLLARSIGHIVTGALATIAATVAAANGVLHFGK